MRRATSLTEAPGAKASATIDCFCSVLHRRRRSGPDNTSTRLIPPSLAPVQITVLAPPLTKTDHPSARKAAANGRLLKEGDGRNSCWPAFSEKRARRAFLNL